jgi:hypothetical protein
MSLQASLDIAARIVNARNMWRATMMLSIVEKQT